MPGPTEVLDRDSGADEVDGEAGVGAVAAHVHDHRGKRQHEHRHAGLDGHDVAEVVVQAGAIARHLTGQELLGAESGRQYQHRGEREREREIAEAALPQLPGDSYVEGDRRELRHELPARAHDRVAGDQARGSHRARPCAVCGGHIPPIGARAREPQANLGRG